MVAGYVLAQPGTGRDALSPLAELFDLAFDASGTTPRFLTIGASPRAAFAVDDPVSGDDGRPAIELVRPRQLQRLRDRRRARRA